MASTSTITIPLPSPSHDTTPTSTTLSFTEQATSAAIGTHSTTNNKLKPNLRPRTARPAALQTPLSATFLSSLYSPLTPLLKREDDTCKTPLTPPPAYLEYLKSFAGLPSPGPLSGGASTSFSCSAAKSPLSCGFAGKEAVRPVLSTNPSTSSVDSGISMASTESVASTSTTTPDVRINSVGDYAVEAGPDRGVSMSDSACADKKTATKHKPDGLPPVTSPITPKSKSPGVTTANKRPNPSTSPDTPRRRPSLSIRTSTQAHAGVPSPSQRLTSTLTSPSTMTTTSRTSTRFTRYPPTPSSAGPTTARFIRRPASASMTPPTNITSPMDIIQHSPAQRHHPSPISPAFNMRHVVTQTRTRTVTYTNRCAAGTTMIPVYSSHGQMSWKADRTIDLTAEEANRQMASDVDKPANMKMGMDVGGGAEGIPPDEKRRKVGDGAEAGVDVDAGIGVEAGDGGEERSLVLE